MPVKAHTQKVNRTLTQAERMKRMRALVGKFAWVPTSVDAFVERKRGEIDIEEQKRLRRHAAR